MKTLKMTSLLIMAFACLSVKTNAQNLLTPTGSVGATTDPFIIAENAVANAGILKILNSNGAPNDKFWIGFSHGTNVSDSYDRARIGVDILAGGYGRLFFTTGPHLGQIERMRIDENGNVGIGLTTPVYNLHVQGTAGFNGLSSALFSSSTMSLLAIDNSTNEMVKATFSGGVVTGSGTPDNVPKWNAAGTGLINSNTMWSVGNRIGIGTAAPNATAALHVVPGSGQTTGIIVRSSGSVNSIGGDFNAQNAANNYGIQATADAFDATESVGVAAASTTHQDKSALRNYGIKAFGIATHNILENFGIRTEAQAGSLGTSTTAYGIYAKVTGGAPPAGVNGSYAGYFWGWTGTPGSGNAAFFNGPVSFSAAQTIISDKKFKENVTRLDNVLEKIMTLTPSTYTLKNKEFPSFSFSQGKQFGFIAQELEKVIPELVHENINPAQYDNEGKKIADAITFKAVDYVSLIPILTAGIQEQQATINSLQATVNELKGQIAKLQPNAPSGISNTSTNTGAMLYQNNPNPFDTYTDIRYVLPQGYTNAKILVFDMNGRQLREIPLQGTGEGKVQLSSGELAAGMYLYSLLLDGKEIDTKRMILSGK